MEEKMRNRYSLLIDAALQLKEMGHFINYVYIPEEVAEEIRSHGIKVTAMYDKYGDIVYKIENEVNESRDATIQSTNRFKHEIKTGNYKEVSKEDADLYIQHLIKSRNYG